MAIWRSTGGSLERLGKFKMSMSHESVASESPLNMAWERVCVRTSYISATALIFVFMILSNECGVHTVGNGNLRSIVAVGCFFLIIFVFIFRKFFEICWPAAANPRDSDPICSYGLKLLSEVRWLFCVLRAQSLIQRQPFWSRESVWSDHKISGWFGSKKVFIGSFYSFQNGDVLYEVKQCLHCLLCSRNDLLNSQTQSVPSKGQLRVSLKKLITIARPPNKSFLTKPAKLR